MATEEGIFTTLSKKPLTKFFVWVKIKWIYSLCLLTNGGFGGLMVLGTLAPVFPVPMSIPFLYIPLTLLF
jgi:hypothetical protein